MASGTERPTTVEIGTATATHSATLAPLAEDKRTLRVNCSAEVRGKPAVIRLGSPLGFGPWAVVHDVAELTEEARAETRVQSALRDSAVGSNDVDGAEKLLKMMAGMWQERQRQKAEAVPTDSALQDEGEAANKPEWCWVSRTEFTGRPSAPTSEAQERRDSVPLPVNLLRRLLFGDDDGSDGDANDGESEPTEDPVPEDNDASAIARASAQERQSFLDAADAALEAYLGQLTGDDSTNGASRLLDDLHLLAATLHYAFTAGALSASMLRGQLIRLLRAFLGSRSAPFPRALESIVPEQRTEAWGKPPCSCSERCSLTTRACRNSLLAVTSAICKGSWMTRLPHSGYASLSGLRLERQWMMLAGIDRDLPRIRQGPLWLGRVWPTLVVEIPLNDFVRRLVEDARNILDAEQVILARLADADGKLNDDDRVLGVGRDGALACGWIEAGKQDVVWLCDSAFQLAEPLPTSHKEPMRRLTLSRRPLGTRPSAERIQRATKYVRIDTAYVWAADASDDGAAARGVEALNRILS